MLQTFRERIQGWLVSLIVTLIVLGLGLFGLQNYWSGTASEVIATVNGHKIYASQLNQAYEQVRHQALENKLSLNQDMQAQLKKEVLQSLIRRQVEIRTVMSAGFKMSLEQLQAAVYGMPFLQENNKFSYSKFHQFLKFSGYTESGFLSEVEQVALIEQLRQGIFLSTFALDDEIEELAKLKNQIRTFDYVVIPYSLFISKNNPSDEEIKKYYEQHQTDFKEPEKIKVDYITLDPESIKKKITLSDAEIKNYYEENKANYEGKSLNDVIDQIKQILISEKLQTTLSTLSDQLSELTYIHGDNLESAGKALKLPIKTSDYFTREGGKDFFSDSSVIRAAFSPEVLVQKRNSDVIRLNQGTLLVLRLKDYTPSKILPLEVVKDQIIKKLKIQMSQNEASEIGNTWLKNLNSKDSNQDKKIKLFMKSKNLEWKSVTASGTKSMKTMNIHPDILKFAFGILPRTDRTKVLGKRLSNGDFVLIRLNSVTMDSNTLTDEERVKLKKRMQLEFGQLDYAFYLESIVKRAKIKIIQ